MRAQSWSIALLSSFALVACAPAPTTDAGEDASATDARPRPDAPEPTFDAESRDVIAAMDGAAPQTCADWCTVKLTSCGDPEAIARELCVARCAQESPAGSAIACLRDVLCVDLRAAISRDVPVCGLAPAPDAGRPDVATIDSSRPDSATMTDARTDATVTDARTDVTVTDARTDATVTDARADAAADATVTDARTDATVTDARVDAATDARTDAATDAPRG
jgi:hypothetical protein